MDWWLACFFIGAIFSLFSPIVPDLFTLILFCILSLTLFYLYYNNQKLLKALQTSTGLLLGASWMFYNAINFQNVWQDNNINIVNISSKVQWVEGEILNLQTSKIEQSSHTNQKSTLQKRIRFNLNVTKLNNNELSREIQLRLSWNEANLPMQQGNKIRVKVKFKPSHGMSNLGSFSYQTWLNAKQIHATGYVINHKDNQLIEPNVSIRQKYLNTYKTFLPDHELSPLLLALGFGSRSDLTKDHWQVLKNTGTGHLIAISGLHIGLVATGVFYLILLLFRIAPIQLLRDSYNIQRFNSRYVAIVLSITAALIYGYLAGFSLPTIRALIMLLIYWAVRILEIKISIKRWLLITLFAITLITPFSLFTASFWLSIYAVIIIFITFWRFTSVMSKGNRVWVFVKSLTVIQLGLTIMLLPISAIFFQEISLVALFSNIIAVPWMSFLIIPLCLLSIITIPISKILSEQIIGVCLGLLDMLWEFLFFISTISWAIIPLENSHTQSVIVIGSISFLLLFILSGDIFTKYLRFKIIPVFIIGALGGGLILDTFSKQINSDNHHNDWKIIVFDVGQGLSVLIQKNKRAILYDTGASYPSGFNMVEAVILPYLQYEGIKQLDKVIISHSDNDHAGGLNKLNELIVIDELIYNQDNEKESSKCLQGQFFNWQGIKVEMLWPNTAVYEENDDSCVILLSDKHHKILLTGDISKKVEKKIINQFPDLEVDALLVPHHGSKTSSSQVFLNQLNPELAIVSAGYMNRWKMPVSEVVKRYNAKDVELLTSAESGQVILYISEKGILKRSYREHLWPFWFANPPL